MFWEDSKREVTKKITKIRCRQKTYLQEWGKNSWKTFEGILPVLGSCFLSIQMKLGKWRWWIMAWFTDVLTSVEWWIVHLYALTFNKMHIFYWFPTLTWHFLINWSNTSSNCTRWQRLLLVHFSITLLSMNTRSFKPQLTIQYKNHESFLSYREIHTLKKKTGNIPYPYVWITYFVKNSEANEYINR